MKVFDRKFGPSLVEELPTTPAVYLFKDDAGRVVYVGKAKNARRRLSNYRNASRRKAHRKMRVIVSAASQVEVRPVPTEAEALVLENELIRELRPQLNVDGKFDFLYPAIGVGRSERQTLLCFTTDREAYEAYGLRWVGCFRSRGRAKAAFDSLSALVGLLGHLERGAARAPYPRIRGSRLLGFRQLGAAHAAALEAYLVGADLEGLRTLALSLLDKPRARRSATDVQAHLQTLADFHRTDLLPLQVALRAAGRPGTFVAQSERDTLFIRQRS